MISRYDKQAENTHPLYPSSLEDSRHSMIHMYQCNQEDPNGHLICLVAPFLSPSSIEVNERGSQ